MQAADMFYSMRLILHDLRRVIHLLPHVSFQSARVGRKMPFFLCLKHFHLDLQLPMYPLPPRLRDLLWVFLHPVFVLRECQPSFEQRAMLEDVCEEPVFGPDEWDMSVLRLELLKLFCEWVGCMSRV